MVLINMKPFIKKKKLMIFFLKKKKFFDLYEL